jgi:predicted MFS family arabinose efflux permease
VCAAVAGASFPPLSPAIRALWPRLAGEQLGAVFALEAVLLDVYFLAGPLLAAAISAAASPEAAVLAGAACMLVGVLAYATAAAPRAWRAGARDRTGRAGALSSRAIQVLLGVWLFNGLGFGFLEVGLTAFAADRGSATSAGLLLGALSAGSIAGGVVYGARRHARPLVRRTCELLLAFAVGMSLLLLPQSVALMAVACAIGGLALAPLTAVLYELIDAVAPAGAQVEANTWLIAASVSGAALGAAFGGALSEGVGERAALAACAVCAFAAAAWLLAARGSLARLARQP